MRWNKNKEENIIKNIINVIRMVWKMDKWIMKIKKEKEKIIII
jgi:hypothetical protein